MIYIGYWNISEITNEIAIITAVDNWNTLTTRNENGMTNEYAYLVTGLTPGSFYSFRLILAMRVEDKIRMSVPGPMSTYKLAGKGCIDVKSG